MASILVVDDEFLLVDILAFVLENEGYEVSRAYHGVMALETIRRQRPSLVVTDFMMPLMTGLELALAVKADPALQHMPILLVSGAQGEIARQHPSLFSAVFDKPYSLPDLLASVRKLAGPPDKEPSP